MKLKRLALAVAAVGVLATGACNRDATVAPGAPAPAPSAPPAMPERGGPTPPPPLQKVVPPVKRVKKVNVNGKVSGFEAGDAETVVFRFTDGAGC